MILFIDMMSKLQRQNYLRCGCEDIPYHGPPPCILQFMKTQCEKLEIDVPNEDSIKAIYDTM